MELLKSRKTLKNLPTEVLLHVLSFLPISDLCRLRKVSSCFLRLIDGTDQVVNNTLWAKASTEGVSVGQTTIQSLERAAKFGNKEALIKLAVAYLYSEGVPDGVGRGTEAAENGIKAAEYIMKLESLDNANFPFSWVLIRPPFSRSFVCCKACICTRLIQHCDENQTCSPNLFYIIGKALSFHEEASERKNGRKWFERGSELGSPSCSYEYWNAIQRCKVSHADVTSIRLLRKIASESQGLTAKFELCRQYALGHYGGILQSLALQYIKQTMSTSPPLLSDKIFKVQHKITRYMMLVLVDWVVEVSEMKTFSSNTVHLAIQLVQRYLLRRSLSRSRVQLLGVTALLLAARWTDSTILTIREASSITDDTYTYQDVVNMLADLLAALKGELLCPLPTDYMEVLGLLSASDEKTMHLASYITESCVVHPDFGGLTTAHFSSSCLLLSRILLHQDYPWSNIMTEATGLTVSDMRNTVISLYNTCFTDVDTVIDYRGVKLNAVHLRYAEERFLGVSEIQVMSLSELKDCLGMAPPTPPTPLFTLTTPNNKRVFSFLSESQYQSNDDSVVSQSFIQIFNSHFITEPFTQHSSPLSSCGSLLPSPIAFNNSSSPIANASFSSNSSGLLATYDEGSSSSQQVPLPGIIPLFSEETVDNGPEIKKSPLRKKKAKRFDDKENLAVCLATKRTQKPFAALNNVCSLEKRSSVDSNQSNKCKKRRS